MAQRLLELLQKQPTIIAAIEASVNVELLLTDDGCGIPGDRQQVIHKQQEDGVA